MGEQVSQILSTMARVISWRDRGIIDDARFQSESLSELLSALEGHDPEFGEAVNLLVKRHDLAVKHFQAIAWLTRRAIHEDLLTPLGVSSPLHKVRDAIVEHVRDAIVGTGERELAVRLVTGLPPDWCTQELLKFAATVRLSPTARRRVDMDLLQIAIHHEGPARAFTMLVDPYLGSPQPAAVDLLAAAYLNSELSASAHAKIRARLLGHSRHGSTASIAPLAVRLSIESRDRDAANLARALARRDDLQPQHPPVLGLILCLAGYRDEAVQISDLPASRIDEFGWWTQAARSLQAFIRASSGEPDTVIELLTLPDHTERPGRSIATVGAMVGRFALMRMRAYLALERWGRAGREARAVLAYHGYRRYDLHMQVAGFEFDVALVSRLAVTPDELLEARIVAERHAPDLEWDTPSLSEGSLFLRGHPGQP